MPTDDTFKVRNVNLLVKVDIRLTIKRTNGSINEQHKVLKKQKKLMAKRLITIAKTINNKSKWRL
ncbi:hypothetical protein TW85_10345 [Marinomonas sp. S3726]|nr:hypothetical protein TW85_10345 [Marinomonas sp. S3726]